MKGSDGQLPSIQPRRWLWARTWAALVMWLGCAWVSPAAEPAAAPAERPRLSEKIATEIGKIQALLDAKNWPEALRVLQTALPTTTPGSYDQAVVSAVLAQVHLQRSEKGDYAAAIPLLERALSSGHYEEARVADFTFLIAQLYLQENKPDKAEEMAKRYLQLVPDPPVERLIFHASLLMTRAQRDTPMNPVLVREVLAGVDRAVLLTHKLTEPLLVLKVVALQSLDRFEEAAEVLELLVHLFPENSKYWPQLFAFYINSGRDLRAALTIERAQAQGSMNTPRENIALVSIYYNMENFPKAIALLEKGLRDGSIDPEPKNWEMLAFAFQRTHRPEKAIEVYKEASTKFKGGRFDALIANIYYGMDNTTQAFSFASRALDKGDVDRPEQLATFTAFLGYELKKYEEALAILEKAAPHMKTDKDRNEVARLKKAIVDAIRLSEPPPTEPAAANPSPIRS